MNKNDRNNRNDNGVKCGKVWLLGAGPGDAELLTLKGRRILKLADTVVYDALVGAGILGWIPDHAIQIYVGKRGGCHAKTQEEIEEILAEQALLGKQVVRLKGGDPFVFGRGSEEAVYLNKRRIPFEVIPGVTSAVAVPAYCGIPVTHRGTSTSFHVITGHQKNGEPVELDYEALMRVGGTLIFLMGLSSSELILNGFLTAGMNPDTPAALLQEGTTAGQKKVISTLSELSRSGKEAGIKAPAIMIIGAVCDLHAFCGWSEDRPLNGKKILVTRPGKRAAELSGRLREAGAEVIELPAIETKLLPENKALDHAIETISSYSWLAFTSPSGVELFFEYLSERKMDVRMLSGVRIAVLGKGTRDMLKQYGLYADYMPERYYAKDLGEGLSSLIKQEEKLLILRAREGSPALIAPLDQKGICYEDIPLYETVFPNKSPQTERVGQLLKNKEFDFVTFTSVSTVNGFINTLHPQSEELSGFTAVCIGTETAKCAEATGMNCIISQTPTLKAMADVIAGERAD